MEHSSDLDPRFIDINNLSGFITEQLNTEIEKNKKISTEQKIDVFYLQKVASISSLDYVKRFQTYALLVGKHRSSSDVTKVALIFLIYLKKITSEGYQLNEFNILRIYAASFTIAAKYLIDRIPNNIAFAKVSGVSAQEFNNLEITFFLKLNCNCTIPLENFENQLREYDQWIQSQNKSAAQDTTQLSTFKKAKI